MVKQGDKVEVDGREARVETQWAQCGHRVYRLSDGREILNLDKSIENGSARIVPDLVTDPEPTIRKVYDRRLGTPLPEPDDEDTEQ